MKKSLYRKQLLFIISLSMLLLAGCGDLKNDIKINQIDTFNNTGRRLVEPKIVTREEFCGCFSLDLPPLFSGAQYVLNYKYDPETGLADYSELTDGVIGMFDDSHKHIFHICISKDDYVPEYVFSAVDPAISYIDSHETELYRLKGTAGSEDIIYARLSLLSNKISFSFSGKSETEVSEIIKEFLKGMKQ